MKKKTGQRTKSVTMRDVAKLAGVSQPTVSRVLNGVGNAPISEETRERVLAVVEELNYHPNILARSLRTQQTQMIAVLLADISNSFYTKIARAIQDVASEYGYDVLIANSDHIYKNELSFCDAVTRRPVDGVVMVPFHMTPDDLTQFVTRTNTPVTVLGQHVDHPIIDVVYADDEYAEYETTLWLIRERGHRRLGFVGVPANLPPGPRRFRGFMRALDEAQIALNPAHVVEGDFTLEGGKRAAYELIRRGDLPSVLVVVNDLMAIGLILALQEAGYRVPEDVAVVGYDDIPEATIVRPTLTTIAQDSRDIGEKLARALFDRILQPDIPRRVFESSRNLIVRDSA